MRLYATIVDDFVFDYLSLRRYADSAIYEDVVNPADGVVYPGICTQIPKDVISDITYRLGGVLGSGISVKTIFMRQSKEGVPVPHQAHNDLAMGRFSLMLYLNREEHCQGGTELVRHAETGLAEQPATEEGVEVWRRDANTPQAWARIALCEMRPNRAFIFDAALMHRALPIAGFGTTNEDARLVLTCFFDIFGSRDHSPRH